MGGKQLVYLILGIALILAGVIFADTVVALALIPVGLTIMAGGVG